MLCVGEEWPGSCLMTGSPGVILENSGGRFLLVHLLVALAAILEVSLFWSAEIAVEVDAGSSILAF